jgi:hypothetical protein
MQTNNHMILHPEEDTCGIAVYSARVMLGIEPSLISLKSFQQYQAEEEMTAEFILSPNPTTGEIVVKYIAEDMESGTYIMEVFDVFGKYMQSIKLNETTTSISLNSYTQGIYFYRISKPDRMVKYGKIMKL